MEDAAAGFFDDIEITAVTGSTCFAFELDVVMTLVVSVVEAFGAEGKIR